MQSRFTHLFIAAGIACGVPASLEAATFTPNVFDDPAPVAAPNGCTGQGSNPTRCSLREAVLAATASDGTNTIALGEGTYQLTIPEAGSPASGDLDFNGTTYSITIQGQGPDKTKIQASAGLNDRIVEFLGTSVNMTVQGITFEGGNGNSDGGGALRYSLGASNPDLFKIQNCNFINNTSAGNGGAISMSTGNSVLVIDGGTYSGNKAAGGGGAIYLGFGGSPSLTSVQNLVLTDNEATLGSGGGLYYSSSQGTSMSNIQATGNRAESGGGLFVGNGGTPTGLELFDSVISNNTSTNGGGGGLAVNSSGLIKIVNTTISDNEAQGAGDGDGGGANMANGGGIQFLNSTVSGNIAADVGGGINYTGGSGTVREFTNSTISGNTANGTGGGGIFTDHTAAISFNNVTIADNTSAGVGGGAWGTNVPVILRNTIFSGNDSGGFTDDCAGVFTSDGFNIFGSPNDGDCEPDGQDVGFNATDIVGDALIGALADNGGPTLTHNLLAASPAIDGGNPGGCVDGSGAILTADQRGAVRPSGAECDIGAVEAAVTDLEIVKTADDEIYVVGDEITYTLTVTNNGPDISPALVSDDLPSGVSFVSADSGCAESGGLVSCDLGNLDPGQSAAVTLVVEAVDDGDIANTATVSGADIDTDPANNSSTVSVNVISSDTGGGGCNLGKSGQPGSGIVWALLGMGLASLFWLRRPGKVLAAFLLGSVMVFGVAPAGAATFTTNVFDDPAPIAAPNGCVGLGSNPTRCSLREAVLSANANADTDEIILGEGTYQLAQTGVDDTAEDGDLDFTQVSSSVEIAGLGPDQTFIDAALINERIFTIAASTMSLSISGVTMRNGNAGSENGGAIGLGSVGDDTINLSDCNFEGNRAAQGGAIEVKNSSDAVFTNIVFTDNEATLAGVQVGGGALRVGESSTLSWANGVVSGNQSAADGGGIYYSNSALVTMTNIEVFDNEAVSRGGGFFISSGPDVDLDQGRIVGNRAAEGGGLYINNGGGGQLQEFNRTTIADNEASGNGGGLWIGGGPFVLLDNSTISGNTSGLDGGAFFSEFGPNVSLNNSTISGNSADGSGGALSGETGATYNFRNSTIFGNSAQSSAGGIFSSFDGLTVTIANSILAGNNAGGAASDCAGVPVGAGLTFTSGNYNLFGEIEDCNVSTLANDQSGINDPGLKDLAENGGPTLTHMLEASSPALDGGNPAGCIGTDGAILTTDQRDFVRPSGPECDIGSVEAAVTNLAIIKTADDETYIVGDQITYTLTVTNNGPSISPAVVTDALPSEVGFISADSGCSESGGTVTCDLGSLNPGESAAVNIVVEAVDSGTIENTATVSGADIDTDPANDSSTVSVNVISNDTGGGGCRIGASSHSASLWTWALLALGLGATWQMRRRPTH